MRLIIEATTAGVRFVPGEAIRLRTRATLPAELLARLRAAEAEVEAAVRALPACAECEAAIVGPGAAWYGAAAVHADCGERAWRRDWRDEAPRR